MRVTMQVLGDPAGQGSKKHVGNGVMVEMSKKLKPWRTAVAEAAEEQARLVGECPMTGLLTLNVTFRFPMPASRIKAIRTLGVNPKRSAPDLDKLIRGVGDGLKIGGLIQDDALIYRVTACKIEVVGWTGAIIELETHT